MAIIKSYTRVLVIVFLSVQNIAAQNYVPNFSFEQKQKCPPDFVSFYREIYVAKWVSANTGTPDYFNACANKCGVPNNWVGKAEASHGEAYMGIIACMKKFSDRQIPYREYLQVQLSDSLRAGVQYYTSMEARLGLSCIASCNGLGMLFTKEKLVSDRNSVFPFHADITFRDNNPPKQKEEWIKICGFYSALGGEQYLTIGNFLSNQQMKYYEFAENLIVTSKISPMAYFYIDKVEVYVRDDSNRYDCGLVTGKKLPAFEGELPEKGKMVLNKLYFDFDKDVILPASYDELNQLAFLLKAKPTVRIGIYGHTDNVGEVKYNQILSENRAKAVKYYLIEKGVSRMRIESKGFGSSRPIVPNQTSEGRRQNRRVEFEVLEVY